MGHVFARLAGHGLALVPHWPYTFERPDAASDAVVVTNWREDGPAKALVDPADAHTALGIVDVDLGHELNLGLTLQDRRRIRVGELRATAP
jgi:hypothetical protein